MPRRYERPERCTIPPSWGSSAPASGSSLCRMGSLQRVAQICASELDERALRIALLRELRAVLPFTSYV